MTADDADLSHDAEASTDKGQTEEDVDSPDESKADSYSDRAASAFSIDSERLGTYFRWGVLFVFGVVILVAGSGLYSSLGAIIDVWVADRYQPIARAGLNFALLSGAVAGVVATLRRL